MEENRNQIHQENSIQPQPTQSVIQPAEQKYTVLEMVCAWLSIALGYLFCRAFPVTLKPFYGLIFIFALYITTTVIMAIKKVKPTTAPILAYLSGLLTAASLFVCSNPFIHFFAFGYSVAAYCYFVYASFGNRLEKGYSSLLLIDFIKALLFVPFLSLGSIFSAILSRRKYRFGNNVAKIIMGIIIACIPTALVLILLSYDADFTFLMGKIFSFNPIDVFTQIISIIFGIPAGMYIFSLFMASSKNKGNTIITNTQCHTASKSMGVIHPLTALAATLPIVFVYAVFFVSQWKYYVSGFAGVLPDETGFANYAREGFFQLCAVSVINLLVLIALNLFIKKNENGNSSTLRIMSVIYSLCTLVLMSTAMAKLVLYISRYGLTPKRVYAFWFMVVLALIFVIILIKQLISKIKVIPTAAIITVVMFLALGLCNADRLIARYNVDRYLDGSLQEINVYMTKSLGDSAVPELTRLYNKLNSKTHLTENEESVLLNLKLELLNKASEKSSVGKLTLPKIEADAALDKVLDDLNK